MSKTKCVVECALHSCAVAAALIVPRLLFAEPPRGLSIPTGVDEIRVLSQNWAAEDAERFYNLPQGSKLLPYEWLLKLEQPSSSQPFLEPDYIRKFGYLPRTIPF